MTCYQMTSNRMPRKDQNRLTVATLRGKGSRAIYRKLRTSGQYTARLLLAARNSTWTSLHQEPWIVPHSPDNMPLRLTRSSEVLGGRLPASCGTSIAGPRLTRITVFIEYKHCYAGYCGRSKRGSQLMGPSLWSRSVGLGLG